MAESSHKQEFCHENAELLSRTGLISPIRIFMQSYVSAVARGLPGGAHSLDASRKDSVSFGIMACSVADIVHAFHALRCLKVGNLVLDTELRCAGASASLESLKSRDMREMSDTFL